MKLPRFEPVNPSTRRAMVEPVLRRYAPQRKAMQLSTVLPNDVEATYRTGMAKAQMIGNVTESALRLGQQILDTKIKTESEAAEAAYVREMSRFVTGLEFAPLTPEGGGKPAWMSGAEDYRERSREVREAIAEQVITTVPGRRRFEALIQGFDLKSEQQLAKLYRDKQIDLSRADVLQRLDILQQPEDVTTTLEDAVGRGVFGAQEAVKLEAEHHERIMYQTAILGVDQLRASMGGMGDDEFERSVARTREILYSPEYRLSPSKRNSVLGNLASLENDYHGRVRKERSIAAYGQMMDLYSDPLRRHEFYGRLASPRVREALGEYYDDLVRLRNADLENGVTDYRTARALENMILDYARGKTASPEDMYEHIVRAGHDGELNKADYDKYIERMRIAEQRRRDVRYEQAMNRLETYFAGGVDPQYLTGPDGQEMRTRLMVAQVKLDEWVDANPGADPRERVKGIIKAAQPVPSLAVDFEGKPTDDPMAVDVEESRRRVSQWVAERMREMSPDGSVLFEGEDIHVETERMNMLRTLRNIELMQRIEADLQ